MDAEQVKCWGRGRGWSAVAATSGRGQLAGRGIGLNSGIGQSEAQGPSHSQVDGNLDGSISRSRVNFSRGRGRAALRTPRRTEFDVVSTRSLTMDGAPSTKRASLGNSTPVELTSNYFEVVAQPNWCIFQYHVDFSPEEKNTRLKKEMLHQHSDKFKGYVFDGASLFTSYLLFKPPKKTMELCSRTTGGMTILTLKLVGQLSATDNTYLNVLNIILRKSMEQMGLLLIARNYFDPKKALEIPAHKLSLWPGFKTVMRNHENGILLNVELVHKVLRQESCLAVIQTLQSLRKRDGEITQKLSGSIVMTEYNQNRTYPIDDIDWKMTPKDTFSWNGKDISFVDYFRVQYNIYIKNMDQPMLVSRPKKRDLHRGKTTKICLIPELVKMTGISDEMRTNHQLMKAINDKLISSPEQRAKKTLDFMNSLVSNKKIQEELQTWDLQYSKKLVVLNGHTIQKNQIVLGNRFGNCSGPKKDYKTIPPNYEWSGLLKSSPMLNTIPMNSWVIIFPKTEFKNVGKLIASMKQVAKPMGFNICDPIFKHSLQNLRPADYSAAMDFLMSTFKSKVQLIFAILPRYDVPCYTAIKRRACLDHGVQSQCLIANRLYNDNNLLTICSKLVIQISAKLGGIPWDMPIPLKNLMIVGFDVHHCGKRRNNSVGAMVAFGTCGPSLAEQIFQHISSCVSKHATREELSNNMKSDFSNCLYGYQKRNNILPDRILMYRDGVGEGHLQYVYETELKDMQEAMEGIYTTAGLPLPKFSFIVVTKRISTRLFAPERNGGYTNPSPGTVADDVVTLPERFDFFLVSQKSREGATVSPTSYNILYDTQGLDPDKLQKLTFMFTQLYYNWNGPVSVPAPCQYAHKLAYLSGTALNGEHCEKLSTKLYFL